MGNTVAVTGGVYSAGTLKNVAAATYKKCCGRGCLCILVERGTGIIVYLTIAFCICLWFLPPSERLFGCSKAKHKQNCAIQIDIVNALYCFFCLFFFFSNVENVCHSYCCEILSSLGLVQDPLKSLEKRLLLITKGFASGPVCLEPMAKFFKSGWRHWECQTQLNMILMYCSFIIVFCSWRRGGVGEVKLYFQRWILEWAPASAVFPTDVWSILAGSGFGPRLCCMSILLF